MLANCVRTRRAFSPPAKFRRWRLWQRLGEQPATKDDAFAVSRRADPVLLRAPGAEDDQVAAVCFGHRGLLVQTDWKIDEIGRLHVEIPSLQSPVASLWRREANLQVFVLLQSIAAHAVDVVHRAPAALFWVELKGRKKLIDRKFDGQRREPGGALKKGRHGANSAREIGICERQRLGLRRRVFDCKDAFRGVWSVEEVLAREQGHRVGIDFELVRSFWMLRQLDFKRAVLIEDDVPVVDIQAHALREFAVRLAAVETEAQVAAVESPAANDVLLITPDLREVIDGIHIVAIELSVVIGELHELRPQRVVKEIKIDRRLHEMKQVLIAVRLALFV